MNTYCCLPISNLFINLSIKLFIKLPIVVPIVLPIVLPIELPIELPIVFLLAPRGITRAYCKTCPLHALRVFSVASALGIDKQPLSITAPISSGAHCLCT